MGSTPAEGRAQSVPEAGGTGAEAATPTTPPAGHDADPPAEIGGLDGGDRWAAGDHPATGRLNVRLGGRDGEQP